MRRLPIDIGAGLPAAFVVHEDGSGDVSLVVAHIEIDLRRVLAALPSATQVRGATLRDGNGDSYTVIRTIELDEHDRQRLDVLRIRLGS